jgi:hypothetical protein
LRDASIEGLRNLAHAHTGDSNVATSFAKALFNSLVDAKEDRTSGQRDRALQELRRLWQAHPDDASIQEWLANAFYYKLKEVPTRSCSTWLTSCFPIYEGFTKPVRRMRR